MRYAAFGYRKGGISNSETQLWNGSWGCWGALAQGSRLRPSTVVNQIVYHTEINEFSGTALKAYMAHHNLTLEQAVRNSVDAILEGYIDYEVEMNLRGTTCTITFNNLHDKRRQRTMWSLFALRCWFTYQHQGKTAEWLLKDCKTSLTLREVILYSQVIQSTIAPLNNRDRQFYYNADGSNAAYLMQMTLTEWRRILKGGYYRQTGQNAEDLWSKGGGYLSSQQVQRTANSWTKDYSDDFRNFASSTGVSLVSLINREFMITPARTMSAEVMQKFVRYVKYRKK